MVKERVEISMSSFTSKGEIFAAVLPDGLVKVWNTSDGSQLAEWKHSDGDSVSQFSSIACSFVGKKRRKENNTCLVALGTYNGDIFTINATSAELKWKSSGHHHSKIAALSFSNKGRTLCAISTDGTTCELNSETGELIKEIKIPKKHISSSVFFSDDKILAASNTKIRVLTLEDGKELHKHSTDSVHHISILNDTNIIITSKLGDKNLQVWNNESSGPVLSMRHPPLSVECKNGCNEDDVIVLSVSESGIAYIWNLNISSTENIVPTKIKVEGSKSETGVKSSGKKPKKCQGSILAARVNSINGDDQVSVLIVYGSIKSPQFTLVNVSQGEDIVIDDLKENNVNDGKDEKDSRGKKRAASDVDTLNSGLNHDKDDGDVMDVVETDNDINEPTMGEKLASLNIMNDDVAVQERETKPPSADSVHVLLKQALHADDRSLLLECLFRQDEKIISNSVGFLNPSDVFKLLESLISMIQSRGIVVTCALPWLKSLLLQHASIIMSQESSLLALNSLYQLIESRVSTFDSVVQLSSSLDLIYTKTVDGVDEGEGGAVGPIIFEDTSDEEDGGDDMETDDEEDNEELEEVSNVSDLEGSDGMVDY
ncbi:hypothetical protein LXL04_032087 [Taraxacum kok-saghyz]